jgi:hypothetical protein
MSNVIATGYEDLAFLVMRDDGYAPGKSYSAADLVRLAGALNIDIRIQTKWEVGSAEFIRCLASCLRRAAAVNDEANEDMNTIFVSEVGASGGPWRLAVAPSGREDYGAYRMRIRGTASSQTSSVRGGRVGHAADASTSIARIGTVVMEVPGTKVDSKSSATGKLVIGRDGAAYVDEFGNPSRQDGPAVFNWSSQFMIFMLNGVPHRLNGPAHLTPERDDIYFIDNEEIGDAASVAGGDGAERGGNVMRSILSGYENSTNEKMSMDQRLKLKRGEYQDYNYFLEEMNAIKTMLDESLD